MNSLDLLVTFSKGKTADNPYSYRLHETNLADLAMGRSPRTLVLKPLALRKRYQPLRL